MVMMRCTARIDSNDCSAASLRGVVDVDDFKADFFVLYLFLVVALQSSSAGLPQRLHSVDKIQLGPKVAAVCRTADNNYSIARNKFMRKTVEHPLYRTMPSHSSIL